MRVALATHDRMLRDIFASHAGFVFKTIGDAFCVAFDTAQSALGGALESQRALRSADWGEIGELKVRMALHTGAAEDRDNDYFGQPLNRVARILAAAHGGQVLVSGATEELVRDQLPPDAQLRHLGEHRLRDLARPEHLYQLVRPIFPPSLPVSVRSIRCEQSSRPAHQFHRCEREMAEVKRLLAAPGCHAHRHGARARRAFRCRPPPRCSTVILTAWLVSSPIDDAALVPETVAAALNLRQEADRRRSTLTQFLRDRNVLLILDNREHVVAACARSPKHSCAPVRPAHPRQQPRTMSIAGETAWPVPPLSLPDHWREIVASPTPSSASASLKPRFFIERDAGPSGLPNLQRQRPPYRTDCWRLDGIALAIELAAARIRVLTLEQIVERLTIDSIS